uniref:Cse1 domain-containing protein n=1 Tax=Globodera pallida TaxID=36090 RepID=A0A183CBE9_GLOPA
MLQYLPDPSNRNTQLELSDRLSWLQIVLELTRIYHSLISQDLPAYFEDNLTPWMEGFLQLLSLKLPDLEAKSVDLEPNEHDKLRCEICEIATLFSQRFEDCFMTYTERFIASVWNLLVMTDSRIRFDSMVSAALSFLAAICQRPHYAPQFRSEGVLKAICENVVVKNLLLRSEDLEIYENEPFEFLKRDVEGSDLETRRRGAADFVRALCKQFEPEVCALLSSAIQNFLTQYHQNPVLNFAKKDVVYYLVSALASKSTTTRHGTTDASQLINVAEFYQEHVRADLLSGPIDDLPILRGDALKFLVLFRKQLNPEQIIECFHGQNGLLDCSIIRFLSSSHVLLHHYVAYAVERLFLMKHPTIPQDNLFNSANIPIDVLVNALFDCFRAPSAYETHYIMKALMRTFSLMDDRMAANAHLYVNKLFQMVTEAVRVPKNPLFVHYIFESLCILIRKAYSKVVGGLDQHVIPIIELILGNDVLEFVPYVLQIIALMLDQSQMEKQRGIELSQEAYVRFFPTLLRPDYWSRSANVPALVLVFESFIRCFPQLTFGAQYSDQVLGIFQRLIGSKAYDQHGFRLANTFISHLDSSGYERPLTSNVILLTMLNRMQQNKTSKYTRQFTLFILRYAACKGGTALANSLETIQAGIYGMVLDKILLTEMHAMPQTTTYEEKRIVTIGAAKLITDTTTFLGQRYAQIVELVVNVLEAFEHKTPTAVDAVPEKEEPAEVNELEYSDPYCKLSYAQHPEPFAPEIGNIKKHFAQAVLVTVHATNPENINCLNARGKGEGMEAVRRLSLNAKSAQLGLGDRMGNLTAEAFRSYGEFVGRNPGKVLIFMGLFTLATLPGLAFVRINLDLYKLFVPLDAPVRFEFEHQKSYNEIPPGKLDLPLGPPPSLIATDPPPASSQMGEGPSAEAAANELKDIPKKRNSRNAPTTKKVHEDPSVPQHNDILRFYVVHRDYENLLHSDTLGKLFDYTNEMMKVTMEYDGETWLFEDFCKKAPAQQQCSNE